MILLLYKKTNHKELSLKQKNTFGIWLVKLHLDSEDCVEESFAFCLTALFNDLFHAVRKLFFALQFFFISHPNKQLEEDAFSKLLI